MAPTNDDLQLAFNNSTLPQLGYTFQKALDCDALKICLVRLSDIQHKAHLALPKHPVTPHWTDQY